MMTFVLSNVGHERNDHFLFSDISLCLQAGDFLQITGENGSGKSTLLRILAGLIEPHQGDVFYDGKSIFKERELYQPHRLYLGHRNGIRPRLTCCENLDLSASLALQKTTKQRIKQVLKHVGLDHLINMQAIYLSAGQQRRLALARFLLQPVEIWILDEPTTALDEKSRLMFTQLLNHHIKAGGIAIMATHQDFVIDLPKKSIMLISHSRTVA